LRLEFDKGDFGRRVVMHMSEEKKKLETKTTKEIIALRDNFVIRTYPSEFCEIDGQAFDKLLETKWVCVDDLKQWVSGEIEKLENSEMKGLGSTAYYDERKGKITILKMLLALLDSDAP
jgi:hypothetical protein